MSVTHPDAQAAPRPRLQSEPALAIAPLGLSLSIFFTLTFALCALTAYIPVLREFHLLEAIWPGVAWGRPEMLVVGAILAFACGWYVALVWGSLYNVFARRRA